jgi:hypothetical protein
MKKLLNFFRKLFGGKSVPKNPRPPTSKGDLPETPSSDVKQKEPVIFS